MPVITLTTTIHAPIERVFDLARSIDLHSLSLSKTNEKAIAGITTGLIEFNEEVTWRAKHFGIYQTLSSKITEFNYPTYFTDEMIKGAFKKIYHQHFFETQNDNTIMKDVFNYEAPLGFLGKLFSDLVLTKYMIKILDTRNQVIKKVAESDEWKKFLTNGL